MYNEEAKKIYRITILHTDTSDSSPSLYFYISSKKIKSCFADLNLTVGLAGRSLRCKKINLIRSCSLEPEAYLWRFRVLDYKALHDCRITYGKDSLTSNDWKWTFRGKNKINGW